jgi:glycosyltransferase involved in cell wall biosynthesis
MPFEPRVSVIVPAFNSQNTIEDCLDSFLRLDYPKENVEIIVVDNGSTDQTRAILERRAAEIVLLHEHKRGPAAARNRGLLNATGQVVAFTDSDCVVESNWLRSIVSTLHEKQVGAAGGRILAKIPCNRIEQFGELIHDHHSAIEVCEPPYVITMNWASRLSVLEEVEFFDDSFTRCEDVDLSYRLLQAGYDFRYVPDAIIYHRNERTLSGLLREGFLHGYYSVQALKRHRQFLRGLGHCRSLFRTYRDLGSRLVDCLDGQNRLESACGFVFEMGKAAGRISGSIRFGAWEL